MRRAFETAPRVCSKLDRLRPRCKHRARHRDSRGGSYIVKGGKITMFTRYSRKVEGYT